MRHSIQMLLAAGCFAIAVPATAQTLCPSVIAGSPEDKLMTTMGGAENPEAQIAALDAYVQAHAESDFIPCVNSYYVTAYLKQNNFDKAIEYGEKDIAAKTIDLNLLINLMRAYVASGKATDGAFTAIDMVPAQIKVEGNPPRFTNVSQEDWEKSQQALAEQLKGHRAYAEYAFFQLLPRVTDAAKRVQYLDGFMQAYPDTANAGQVNFQYFLAYQMANNAAKSGEYGEKAVAADATNVSILSAVADDYATRGANLDKASEYSKKILDLAPKIQRPEGMTDEQFKMNRDTTLGLAHYVQGYVALLKGQKFHKVGPAIQELKTSADLLSGNPPLQARALYYLGVAYEVSAPANHKGAADALARSAGIASPWQGQAQDLLAKVRAAQTH